MVELQHDQLKIKKSPTDFFLFCLVIYLDTAT